jgi:AcrR family transcriptional regulator
MTPEPFLSDRSPVERARGGRPRGFDRDRVLTRAGELFARHGYEGLSVSELAAGLDLSHPSLYAAFGPKPVLYRKALDQYAERWTAAARTALSAPCLSQALTALIDQQVSAFCEARSGCMLSAALQTSASDHAVEARHAAALRATMIRVIRWRLDQAVLERALPRATDTTVMATCVAALIHGLSTLARDGLGCDILSAVGQSGIKGLMPEAPALPAETARAA